MHPATEHETRPEAVLETFSQALSRGDLDIILSLYEDEACLIPQPHRPAVHGKAAIREALQQFVAIKAHIEIQRTTSVQAGDVALLRSAWQLTGVGPDGAPIQVSHESTDVMRRQPDGRWKIVIDHPFGGDPS